jgi:LysR family positive regulator for ilvC
MNHDALRQFLELARSLHFGRASRACHLSPSALSRSIQRLEAEVGRPLFERDNRSVALTPAGVAFRGFATETLARWETFRDALHRSDQQLSGTLSVFASVTACHSFLPRILSRFRQAHPRVQLRLETGHASSALEYLEEGRADVSVAALPDRVPRHLRTHLVTQTPLVFLAPAAAGEVSRQVEQRPIAWAAIPMVLPEFGLAREAVNRWFRDKKLRPRIYSEVAGNEAILALVALGCGVGVLPRLVADRSPLRSEVRIVDVRPRLPAFRVGFCVQRRRLDSPLIAAFWDSIETSPVA